MPTRKKTLRLAAVLAVAAGVCPSLADAASFEFGFFEANGVANQPSAEVVEDDVTMSIAASPPGAVLIENSVRGLGVNSRGIAGATDENLASFDLLGGSLAGQADAVTFSFDTAGLLTELRFDGVGDERFEFFQLTTPAGESITFFDSQIGLRLVDVGLLEQPNVTLLLETTGADDDLPGLSIPFRAGEVFTLRYGAAQPDPSNFVPGFVPEVPNGALFQGLTVTAIPEPTTLWLLATAATARECRRWRASRS